MRKTTFTLLGILFLQLISFSQPVLNTIELETTEFCSGSTILINLSFQDPIDSIRLELENLSVLNLTIQDNMASFETFYNNLNCDPEWIAFNFTTAEDDLGQAIQYQGADLTEQADLFNVLVYPQPMTIDSSGALACGELSIALLSGDGTVCWKQSKMCAADTDRLEYNFLNPNDPTQDSIAWNFGGWESLCPDLDIMWAGSVGPCRGCPEICDYSNPLPGYWTSSCPEATPIYDLSLLNFTSCTPPLAVEDHICEPSPLCLNGTNHNTSWFALVAGDFISIKVSQIGNCVGFTQGIQAGVFDECPCLGGECLYGSGDCPNDEINIFIPNPVFGKIYYLFIDGCQGAQCFYEVNTEYGDLFEFPCPEFIDVYSCETQDPPFEYNKFCLANDTVPVYIEIEEFLDISSGLNPEYTFTMSALNGSTLPISSPFVTSDPFIEMIFETPDVYTLCFEKAENDFTDTSNCNNLPLCVDITIVESAELQDENFPMGQICYSEFIYEGYFPSTNANGNEWLGPRLYLDDFDANGCHTQEIFLNCGCSFSQNVCLELIDELFPIDYDVFLCLDDEWCFEGPDGILCLEAGEANGEVVFLPGLAPNGCGLPVFLTIYKLGVDNIIDTTLVTCDSIELKFTSIDTNDITQLYQIQYEWSDQNGMVIGTTDTQLFLTEGKFNLKVNYDITNTFGEQWSCEESYDFDIMLEGQQMFADNDNDGYGDPNDFIYSCDTFSGFVLNGEDCNDQDPTINPDAIDIPNNGVDEDCNGIDLMVGIHSVENIQIYISPNPFLNFINIECSEKIDLDYYLFDASAKIIEEGTLNSKRIEVSDLPKGIYILQLKSSKAKIEIVEKLLKIN